MTEGVFAEAGLLRLEVDASALLRRRPEIRRATLVRPRLNLVIDRQGRTNWNMADAAPPEDAGTAPAEAFPAPIFVEDGMVTILDERTGKTASFANLDLTLKVGSLRGPVELEGHADWRGERVQLALFVKSPQELTGAGTAFDLNLSTSRLTLAFNGHGVARRGIEAAGQLDVRSSSIGELVAAGSTTSAHPAFGPFEATGGLTLGDDRLSLRKARFAFDGMRAEGDLSLDLSQAAPRVTARLGIDRLDARRYAPFRDAATKPEGGEGVEAWDLTPIDFTGLKEIEATAALRVKELVYDGLAARDVTVEAKLTGGVLDAKLRDINLYEGKASGQIVLDGARQTPTIQASFQGKGVDGRQLLNGYAGFDGIEGATEIAVAVAAQGRNESEMIASMRGRAGFSFTNGTVRGIDIASLMRGISKSARSGWQESQGERTDFTLLKASFTLSDGIAENNDLQLLGPVVRMSGAGNVDLLRREIDFRIEPRLVERLAGPDSEAAAGPGVPILVKGPWGRPTIAPEAGR